MSKCAIGQETKLKVTKTKAAGLMMARRLGKKEK
jgi:hypothetical protein